MRNIVISNHLNYYDAQVDKIIFNIFVFNQHSMSYYPVKMGIDKVKLHDLTLTVSDLDSDNLKVINNNIFIYPANKLYITTIAPVMHPLVISDDSSASIRTTGKQVAIFNNQGNRKYQLQIILDDDDPEPVYLNNQRITKKFSNLQFEQFDRLKINNLIIQLTEEYFKLIYLNQKVSLNKIQDIIANNLTLTVPKNFPNYKRSPRILLNQPTDTLEIKLPTLAISSSNSILKLILPTLGMSAASILAAVLTRYNPAMILATGLGIAFTICFSVIGYWHSKQQDKKQTLTSENQYQEYLLEKTKQLFDLKTKQISFLNYHYPNQTEIQKLVNRFSSRIYERQSSDDDFLKISLGLTSLKSSYKILFNDDSKNQNEETNYIYELIQRYSSLENSQLITSIKNTTIGIVGSPKNTNNFMKSLLFQIASFHSYQDVNFVSVINQEDKLYFQHLSNFKHSRIHESNLSGIISNGHTRDIILTNFYQLISKRMSDVKQSLKQNTPKFKVHYIFTIFDDNLLAGHPINELLDKDLYNYGITVIYLKQQFNQLPETCDTTIQLLNSQNAQLINDHGNYRDVNFRQYQNLSNTDFDYSVRLLSGLNHLLVARNQIPNSLSLLEQYDVKRVEDLNIAKRYRNSNPIRSIASLIGKQSKKDLVFLDLHERRHGPHALIGGTTGSGKSELLTTYLLGLAINYSPEQIGILIIDWKGGGIANSLIDLPHFLGAITNLDNMGTERALISITAELKNRQKQFAKYDVNNINGYTKLYLEGKLNFEKNTEYPTNPIPHLILISDEFAELKSHVPEFLDELTSVARIGRSLGVHLILATQKPSGIVNDQIEANSNSKIALKMQTEADSKELLKTTDAANIVNPGRGYLKVGNNEIYDLFQSGYAGADYNPDQSDEHQIDTRIYKEDELGQYQLVFDNQNILENNNQPITQQTAVINEINRVNNQINLKKPKTPWLPDLKSNITSPTINFIKQWNKPLETKIPLGLLDIPSKQEQITYYYDIQKSGCTLLLSSAGFGKSTTIQSIILNLAKQNNPEQIQFNLLDFGINGLLPLKDLPHVIDVVTIDEEEKLAKILRMITKTLKKRGELFKQQNVSNYQQYNQKTNHRIPIIVNVIDSYDSVQESKLADDINQALNECLQIGPSLGIFILMSANRLAALYSKTISNIQTKIVMFLAENDDARSILGSKNLELPAIHGRGQLLIEDNPTAIQIYTNTNIENPTEYLDEIKILLQTMRKEFKGKKPDSVPMVPNPLRFETVASEIAQAAIKNKFFLGKSLLTAESKFWNLLQQPFLIVSLDTEEQAKIWLVNLRKQFGSQNKIRWVLIDLIGDYQAYKNEFDDYIEDLTTFKINFFKMITEYSDIRTIYYFADIESSFSEAAFTKKEVIQILNQKSGSNSNFIFQGYNNFISNTFDENIKILRSRVKIGLFGSRLAEQRLVSASNLSVSEEFLKPDEQYYYLGRNFEKLRFAID